eukprot:1431838-Amphidinium_carterae.1
MICNLDDVMINEKIFPECVNGFTDSSGPIREATVKSLVFFVPRLKAKTVEGRIVKLLLKTMTDPEASIRTNSVICCGRVSASLPKDIANQTLGQALGIGLKDPFGPCRAASLRTLLATVTLFSPEELAMKLMPMVCQRLVDPEPTVSDVAFEVLTSVQKELKQQIEENRSAAQNVPGGTAAQDAAKAAGAGTWGSWAFSTVGSVMGSTLAGTMMSSGSLANVSSAGSAGSGNPSPRDNELPPPPQGAPSAPPSSAAGSQRPRASSGMTLASKASSAVKPAAKSAPVLGLGEETTAADAGAGWGEDEDFWDDFGDMSDLPTSSIAEQKAAPKAAAPPAASTTPARPAAAKQQPVSASAKPKAVPLATKVTDDDDDFWK